MACGMVTRLLLLDGDDIANIVVVVEKWEDCLHLAAAAAAEEDGTKYRS
jgi:hypothetical protein